MRNLLPRLLDVLMFGGMTRRNPFCDPEFERLFEASFDETLRRSVAAYLKREGISASRFGRTVLGDPGFVKTGLMKGRPVKLHTADRIRDFMHETPFGPLFGFEIEAFISLTGLKPWSLGEQSVNQPEFVARLRRGASPYLTTLDRVRGWMRTHVRPAERRAIVAAVVEAMALRAAAAPARTPMPVWHGGGPMKDHPKFMNTEEAAAFLELSHRTLERYRITGEGPRFLKIGRWVRYLKSDLVDWLESRGRISTSDDGSDRGS